MRPSRALRVLRGWVAASVATFVALLSHVAGGGEAPGWLGLAVPWVLSVAICTMLAGRTLSLARLSLGVATSQLLFHGLFVLGAVGPAGASTPGHHHGEALAVPVASLGLPMAADPLMWAAHGAAAIVTVAALHRGERAITVLLELARRVATWLRLVAVRVLTAPAPAKRLARGHVDDLRVLAPLGRCITALRRRGPPVLPVI